MWNDILTWLPHHPWIASILNPRAGLLAAIFVMNILFVIGWVRAIRQGVTVLRWPRLGDLAIGFVTEFLDALGIGSFAPTTALFKLRGSPRDELIPGTLNVGHCLGAVIETAVFVTAVRVNPILLVATVGSATLGGWLGAGVVSRLPRREIQVFMGVALLIAATVFVMANVGAFPAGGVEMDLSGWKFYFAVIMSCGLGALMSIGIGIYAPQMIMLALLGLNPLGAFPIMMGSCGLLQPVASLRFFKTGRFDFRSSIGLTMGGVPGILIAVFIVESLPLQILRWLVAGVVMYAALSMLRSARRENGLRRSVLPGQLP
jgi:uncharacterized membrane protein YfcA